MSAGLWGRAAINGTDLVCKMNVLLLAWKAKRKGRSLNPVILAIVNPKNVRSPQRMVWSIAVITGEMTELSFWASYSDLLRLLLGITNITINLSDEYLQLKE